MVQTQLTQRSQLASFEEIPLAAFSGVIPMPADPSVVYDALRLASILFSAVGGVVLTNEAMKGVPVLFSSYSLILRTLVDLGDPPSEPDAGALEEKLKEAIASKLRLLTGGGFLAAGIVSELLRSAFAIFPTLSTAAAAGGLTLFVLLGLGIVGIVAIVRPKLYAATERMAARHERMFRDAS